MHGLPGRTKSQVGNMSKGQVFRSSSSSLLLSRVKQRLARKLEWIRLPPAARQEIRRDHAGYLYSDPGPDKAIRLMVDWLLEAQAASSSADGGFARHYSVANGWGPSYPETTGYIIPTLIDVAEHYGESRYRDSARCALDWCRSIQFDDGAFQSGVIDAEPRVAVTFNTGQILIGLARGACEFDDYREETARAADWLVETMDDDGCWRRFPTPFAASGEKTYETHVSWGLLEAARALDEPCYGAAALKNIDWALTKQQANGWFADCGLGNPATPLTHTIGYALRGIIEGYLYSEEPALLRVAELTARPLLQSLDNDGRLPGCFDAEWKPTVPWSCLTGAVQIAACWFLLHEITNDPAYLSAACKANAFVRRTVHQDDEPGWRGGVKGSYPVDGGYGRYEFLSWAAKFAIDSNLMEIEATR